MDSCGLYVHFPYCAARCTYCDFNTYVVDEIPAVQYADAIVAEGAARAPEFAAWRLSSVYFGGGTPSLWGAESVRRVLNETAAWFPRCADGLEVTLECNPGEADPAVLAAFRDAGVNRLSLGVQSLSDPHLATLNRRHTAAEALDAAHTAQAAGFDSVSCDLIFGLPGQDVAAWTHDLRTIAELGIPHLSVYHLTLEPGMALTRDVHAGRVQLPDEDAQADMWEAIEPTLAPFGLSHYEVSSFAAPAHHSRHNTLYWRGRPYLGLGAGAHSFRPPPCWDSPGAAGVRSVNKRHHSAYIDAIRQTGTAIDADERLDRTAHLSERMFTGLRRSEGLSLSALAGELAGDPLALFSVQIAALVDRELVTFDGDTLALTPLGRTFADDVFVKFI